MKIGLFQPEILVEKTIKPVKMFKMITADALAAIAARKSAVIILNRTDQLDFWWSLLRSTRGHTVVRNRFSADITVSADKLQILA